MLWVFYYKNKLPIHKHIEQLLYIRHGVSQAWELGTGDNLPAYQEW